MSINMEHCRMTNTLEAVEQCIEGIRNQDITSQREVINGNDMFITILDFCKSSGIIEDYDRDMVKVTMDDSYIPKQDDDDE
ncbi:hypothetical protein CN918_29480 [Priestia megaterium]|nr:hypothetical protein CN918_29480 [Priestia megaterium]